MTDRNPHVAEPFRAIINAFSPRVPPLRLKTVRVSRMNGDPWLSNHIDDFTNEWRWITEAVTFALAETHPGVDYADFSIREDENLGDVLTVRGEDVGLLS